MSINIDHRLSGHDPQKPESCTLTDAVDGMTRRAQASISTLQSSFIAGNDSVNNEAAFYALESIYMELTDIQKTVFEFYKSQKSPIKFIYWGFSDTDKQLHYKCQFISILCPKEEIT